MLDKAKKQETIIVRVELEIKEGLIQLAKLDERTLSDYIRLQLKRLVESANKQ